MGGLGSGFCWNCDHTIGAKSEVQWTASLDWHQVLDIKRHSRGTDRPSPPYTLLPEYEQLIRGLKDRGVAVLVCSYNCSPSVPRSSPEPVVEVSRFV